MFRMHSDQIIEAAKEAVSCERSTGVPAELTLAQWALESGWGAHQPGNNCFGIKAFPGCQGVQVLETFEVIAGVKQRIALRFATFSDLSACFSKHAELIHGAGAYRHVWNEYTTSKCLTSLIKGIAPIYASDPSYAETLLRIINMDTVVSALASARQS